jgi:hypothetical protein
MPALVNVLANTLLTNHPALLAAGARAEAAAANLGSVRTWEDPTVILGGMFAEAMMRAEDGDLLYGVEQKLPLFGRPRAQRQMAARDWDVMRADREALFQRLRSDLAKALFRAAYAQRAAEIGAEDLVWLAAMVRTAEDRYRLGDLPQTHLLRLENEYARRADAVTTDRRRVAEALAEVNRGLGQAIDTPWPQLDLPPVADAVSYDDRLVGLAVANEPFLAVLREKVRLAEAAVEATRRTRHPEVALGAEGRNYSGNGEFRQAMVTVSLTLPWINGGKYRQDVRRESARRAAAEFDLADQELAVREEVRRLTVGLDAARRGPSRPSKAPGPPGWRIGRCFSMSWKPAGWSSRRGSPTPARFRSSINCCPSWCCAVAWAISKRLPRSPTRLRNRRQRNPEPRSVPHATSFPSLDRGVDRCGVGRGNRLQAVGFRRGRGRLAPILVSDASELHQPARGRLPDLPHEAGPDSSGWSRSQRPGGFRTRHDRDHPGPATAHRRAHFDGVSALARAHPPTARRGRA